MLRDNVTDCEMARVSERNERLWAHTIMIIALCSMLEDIFSCILTVLGLNPDMSNYISWIIYGLMFAYVVWKLFQKRRLFEIIVFECIVLIIVMFSQHQTPEIHGMIKNNITTLFLTNVIAFFVGKYGFIKESIFKHILAITPWYAIAGYIYIVLLSFVRTDNYMNTSYNLLFITCLCIFKAFSEKRVLYAVLAGVNSIYILMAGASGVVLTIVVVVIAMLHSNLKKNTKILATMACVVVGMIIFVYYQNFLSMLAEIFPDSRTVNKVIESNFFTTPRFKIWKYITGYICKSPFKINGIFADRVIITYGNLNTDKLGQYVLLEQMGGLYAHNIVLECIAQFGIIIGIILILKFISMANNYRKYVLKNECSTEKKNFVLCIAYMAMVPLMVSSSYLVSFNFWMLLGIFASVKIDRKYNGRRIEHVSL